MNNEGNSSMQDEDTESYTVGHDSRDHHSTVEPVDKPKSLLFDDLFGVPVWALMGLAGLVGIGGVIMTSGVGSKPSQTSTASLPAVNTVEPVSHVIKAEPQIQMPQPQAMQEPAILGGVANSSQKTSVDTPASDLGSPSPTEKPDGATAKVDVNQENKIMAAIDRIDKRQDGLEDSLSNITSQVTDIQSQLIKMTELMTPKKATAPIKNESAAKRKQAPSPLSQWTLDSSVEGSEAMITNTHGDSHVVAIGDSIDGAKVLRIYMNKVVTSHGDIFAH